MPLGIVLRRRPGVTRWARWSWQAVDVLPGAGPAAWTELRREGETVDFHAATVPLELFRTDTEAYAEALAAGVPSVAVVFEPARGEARPRVLRATVSAYQAQDELDSGELVVDPVPMPPGLLAWVDDFLRAHHAPEPFVKRRRDRHRVDLKEDGRGDPRIAQDSDVYRAPRGGRGAR
ncbi:DUF3305 domain-containing protein [Rhodobacteraceae bacterium 2CG4]|uniref:DUF3305 domain-containing protein n=2 Tax=Halovulum marinum TaxID=2662447 RepID=A0A6L5Z1H9_9RHOB|nr:DUF3305 domain-containing protein [Halovulum marinum]